MTGDKGRLGSELMEQLLREGYKIYGFKNYDITIEGQINEILKTVKPDIVIHCAAVTDTKKCEENPFHCYHVNSVGTYNLVLYCALHSAKLVYISTDHVFDGKKGNYKETDIPNPQGHYAKSKLMGEWFTLAYPNNLVIRTSFMKSFPFKKAFTDKYGSWMWIEDITKEIVKAIKMDLKGIYHVAGKRRSVYEFVKERYPHVDTMEIKDLSVGRAGLSYLRDTSLNVGRFNKRKNKLQAC